MHGERHDADGGELHSRRPAEVILEPLHRHGRGACSAAREGDRAGNLPEVHERGPALSCDGRALHVAQRGLQDAFQQGGRECRVLPVSPDVRFDSIDGGGEVLLGRTSLAVRGCTIVEYSI